MSVADDPRLPAATPRPVPIGVGLIPKPASWVTSQLRPDAQPAGSQSGTSRLVRRLGVWITSQPRPATQPAGSQSGTSRLVPHLGVWMTSRPDPATQPAGSQKRNQPAGSAAGCLDNNQPARPSRPATQPAGSQTRNQPAGLPLDVWVITSRPDPAAQPPSRLVPKKEPAGWMSG